jgi:hypothetical protein
VLDDTVAVQHPEDARADDHAEVRRQVGREADALDAGLGRARLHLGRLRQVEVELEGEGVRHLLPGRGRQ